MTFEERIDKFGNRFLTDGEKWALVSGKLFDYLEGVAGGRAINVYMPVLEELNYGPQLVKTIKILEWRLEWYVTNWVKRPCYMVDDGKRMPEEWEYEYHMK